MIFYQILTKFDQILTISVKNHQIHVKKIQKCDFLKITKKTTSKINPELEGGLCTGAALAITN